MTHPERLVEHVVCLEANKPGSPASEYNRIQYTLLGSRKLQTSIGCLSHLYNRQRRQGELY